ncbi:GDP-mannose 4,6-dehydratase [Desulfobacula toluolica]|uniref:GDP-mannose 4,6-dehydratase n=1 Tax=Desulfobacula toluolica (strain DSM 7467 / Tol2) TaxID=651182 RepID=K0NBJ3_DESTT|nr:GDP-mannose 4,6-dehydratase [Desulfobacula toluolica]CCK81694.1 Gmd2: GDP-mannose 4,6-dehydratase [Desulfobacula toluolica Tol2]
MKTALITGITGQDGSYLADLLLEKGYTVYGLRRRTSTNNLENINHLQFDPHADKKNFNLLYGDLSDSSNINRLIDKIKPDEIYNLAAQSHVRVSFDVPEYTADIDALGPLRILEAIRESNISTRFYQASTSELYGDVLETPQNENTPFNPRSPYAIAKHYAFQMVKSYREAYNLFACNGILFNHESPKRGTTFVTRKITYSVARIFKKKLDRLYLGNLDAKRDWGYAPEYVEAMWRMLQQDEPKDIVIGTGETHSVRQFVEYAFAYVDIDIVWENKGVDEVGVDKKNGKVLVSIDPYFYRPAEVDMLLSDPSFAKKRLNWSSNVGFKQLVEIMMESDLEKS